MTELTPHNANQVKLVLSSTIQEITVYENAISSAPGSPAIKSIDLIYPCTIWATPNSGASVEVFTSFDGGTTLVPWPNGVITSAGTYTLNSCPGDIVFKLVSGTGANVGIT